MLGGLGFKEAEPQGEYDLWDSMQAWLSRSNLLFHEQAGNVIVTTSSGEWIFTKPEKRKAEPVIDAEVVVMWTCPNCHRDWPLDSEQGRNRVCDECDYRQLEGSET